jgi:pimeloyl-ACP methyl ester carboxylesterase
VHADDSQLSKALVDRYFDLTLCSANRQAFVDRLKLPADSSYLNQINRSHQQALLLWGEEDALIKLESAHRFHLDIPNDTLVILENSSCPNGGKYLRKPTCCFEFS